MSEALAAPPGVEIGLSRQQRRRWALLQQGEPLSVAATLRVRGTLRQPELAAAAERVAARHGILATSFVEHPGLRLPRQRLGPEPAVSWQDAAAQAAGGGAASNAEATLQQAALRLALAAGGDGEALLSLHFSPLAADAESLQLFARELVAELAGGPAGAARSAPEPVQYAEFVAWQDELAADPAAGAAAAIFRRPALLAAQRFRLAAAGSTTSGREARELDLSAADTAALERLAASLEVEMASVLLAGWQAVLLRLAEEPPVAVAELFDGRPFEELGESLGPFSLAVPILAPFGAASPFADACRAIEAARVEAASAQESFALTVGEEAGEPHAALFVVEDWSPPIRGAGLELQWATADCRTEASALCLAARRWPAGWRLTLDWDSAALSLRDGEELTAALVALLRAAAAAPATVVGRLPLLAAAAQERLAACLAPAATPAPFASLPALLTAAVARQPAATALCDGQRQLSFAELEARAASLAFRLQRQGIGLEARVGVAVSDPLAMGVALLGVLKAGAAYVPVDPSYPAERARYVLADAGVALLLADEAQLTRLPDLAAPVLHVEPLAAVEADSATTAERLPEVLPESLAYVLYTSGSTGRPKGVAVTHRGLTNYLRWAVEAYRPGDGDGAPLQSSIGFDLTVTALWAPLLAGRSVRFLPADSAVEALALLLRERGGFSLLKATPTQLKLLGGWLPPAALAGRTRTLVVGGEALHGQDVAAWRQGDPAVRLVNEYGPTETVVGCAVYEVPPGPVPPGPVPIGRPIANTRLSLLDRHLEPVPAGYSGELFIAGEGVARGYHGRPGLTAARFLPDPAAREAGARCYRSGDLVRLGPGEELAFLGRADRQIKLHGLRVELGEIEAVLTAEPEVGSCAVVARTLGTGDERLVAYVVPKPGCELDAGGLRAAARRQLPEALVPSAFVGLAALPLDAHGKLELAALPEPPRRRGTAGGSELAASASETERQIAALWARVLRLEQVGLHENFFDLGGHSYLMFEVHRGLAALVEREVPILGLFSHPTVSSLASYLASLDDGGDGHEASQERGASRAEAMQRQRRRRQSGRDELRSDGGSPPGGGSAG